MSFLHGFDADDEEVARLEVQLAKSMPPFVLESLRRMYEPGAQDADAYAFVGHMVEGALGLCQGWVKAVQGGSHATEAFEALRSTRGRICALGAHCQSQGFKSSAQLAKVAVGSIDCHVMELSAITIDQLRERSRRTEGDAHA